MNMQQEAWNNHKLMEMTTWFVGEEHPDTNFIHTVWSFLETVGIGSKT